MATQEAKELDPTDDKYDWGEDQEVEQACEELRELMRARRADALERGDDADDVEFVYEPTVFWARPLYMQKRLAKVAKEEGYELHEPRTLHTIPYMFVVPSSGWGYSAACGCCDKEPL